MSRILILANHYNTLRIFRRELIKELVKQGNIVYIAIPKCDKENINILKSYGAIIRIVNVDRRSVNPLKDIKLFFDYRKLIKHIRPDKVITYTIKPNIYGGIYCRLAKIPYYANITGLGSAFQDNSFIRKLVSLMYSISLKKAKVVFFENIGNKNTLVNSGIVSEKQTVVMAGAGVNLDEFTETSYPDDNEELIFLFIGRIMKEKGVNELFTAIRMIKKKHKNVRFQFIGWYEDDYKEKVNNLVNEKLIEFYGFQPNVKPFIKKCHCVILPSYHEGMSNTLLESAAMCRPLITSNIYGCKEAVIDGKTGYLVNVKDSADLQKKIVNFIELSYEEKKRMGVLGRQHMINSFDKNIVVKKTIFEISKNN